MKKILPILFLAVLCCACPKPNSSDNPLEGKWEMKNYSAFMPERPVINSGEIIWTFNTSINKLDVANQIEDKYTFIQKSGTYDYTTNNDKITFDGQTFDYRFKNGELIISDKPELDGPMITFKRVE